MQSSVSDRNERHSGAELLIPQDCVFESTGEPGFYRCALCGFENTRPWKTPARRNCPVVAPPTGPGSELTRLLAKLGIKKKSGCGCAKRAAQMDAWGTDECERRIDEIADWLVDAADDSLVTRYLPGAVKAIAAKSLIREAIRRARATATPADRPA